MMKEITTLYAADVFASTNLQQQFNAYMKEKGHDFSYYNQRAIVGAPGMSDAAAAYYREIFGKVYEGDEWQAYLASESLSPLPMDEAETRAYWATQVQNHRKLLSDIGS